MQFPQNGRRLAIFAFYDADGVVDDYIPYLLREVGKFCSEQIAVINGSLCPAGEAALRSCCTQILLRPNKGLDVTGYKEAFLGLTEPDRYDEILFYNQTIFGPVSDLAPLFRRMEQQDVDFWGLTKHKGAPAAGWDNTLSIPPHLQSFFFAVRRSLFITQDFYRYWNELPPIEQYWDAVARHEIRFTRYFEALGYRWCTGFDTADLEGLNDYPLMGMPVELLRRGCPFVKRKSFLCSPLEYSSVPQGTAAADALDWLLANSRYPLQLITQNLLRTADLTDITRAIAPYFLCRKSDVPRGRTAVVLWFTGSAAAPLLCRAAEQLTPGDRLFCIFSSQKLADLWLPRLPNAAEWRVSEQNGLAVLFGPLWHSVADADWLLYLNDGLPGLLGEFVDATTLAHAVRCLTPGHGSTLLSIRPEFGVAGIPPGVHQETLAAGQNRTAALQLLAAGLQAAGICMPPTCQSAGPALRGAMFFARTGAVAALHRFPFTDVLFEGLYPAAEYLIPLAAQSAGALTAFLLDDRLVRAGLAGQKVLLDAVLQRWYDPEMPRSDQMLFRMDGIRDFYAQRHDQMTLQQAFSAELTLKQKLWICSQLFIRPEAFARLHRS